MLDVGQNLFIAHAAPFFVDLRVHILDICDHIIGQRIELRQNFRLGLHTGFYAGVNASLAAGFQQFQRKFPLHGGLTAADGDAAAGVGIKVLVSGDFRHDLLHGHTIAPGF